MLLLCIVGLTVGVLGFVVGGMWLMIAFGEDIKEQIPRAKWAIAASVVSFILAFSCIDYAKTIHKADEVESKIAVTKLYIEEYPDEQKYKDQLEEQEKELKEAKFLVRIHPKPWFVRALPKIKIEKGE